jgi:hypothetical protein
LCTGRKELQAVGRGYLQKTWKTFFLFIICALRSVFLRFCEFT